MPTDSKAWWKTSVAVFVWKWVATTMSAAVISFLVADYVVRANTTHISMAIGTLESAVNRQGQTLESALNRQGQSLDSSVNRLSQTLDSSVNRLNETLVSINNTLQAFHGDLRTLSTESAVQQMTLTEIRSDLSSLEGRLRDEGIPIKWSMESFKDWDAVRATLGGAGSGPVLLYLDQSIATDKPWYNGPE